MVNISINNINISVEPGTTILKAAGEAGIYIPSLCNHPDLKPFRSIQLADKIYQGEKEYYNEQGAAIVNIKGCGLCIVEIEGETMPKPSCGTIIAEGMAIKTVTEFIKKKRRENLIPILAAHPHSCLTCAQREGCITASGDCSNSVVLNERCCELNGACELQRLVDYVGIAPETPKYHHQGIPRIEDGNLFIRDYNLCISCGRCVRACQQLRNVFAMGTVINNGRLVVGSTKGPHLSEAECRFCGACVEVCPTGALQDKMKPRLKDESDYVPCRHNCPGDVEIPVYLKLISDNRIQEAADVISSRLTFPNSLGKICFHPCETDCRRNVLSKNINNHDGAVSIRSAKDYAMSNAEDFPPIDKLPPTGKKIAIIGAGPAGLSAGFYLSLKGHKAVIYEQESKAGGMLRYGVPRYRLPEEILEKDLRRINESGIEYRFNVRFGSDISINSLFEEHFDAVFISTGLPISKKLPGVLQNDKIINGIEFLNQITKGEINKDYFLGRDIAVIGGGNVASDVARSAVRLGANNVQMICLEQFNEMPAYKQEITEAVEEGISILNGWGVKEIIPDGKNLNISLIKCVSVFDAAGGFNPVFDNGLVNSTSAGVILIAIGQQAENSIFESDGSGMIFKAGLVHTLDNTTKTAIKGVFAGGDIVSGPSSLINAVGSAKKAAREIDIFLGGDGIISGDLGSGIKFDSKLGKIDEFCRLERTPLKILPAELRRSSFEPVELSMSAEESVYETSRCLQCQLRLEITQNPFPPRQYLEFNKINIESVPETEGVIQLLDINKETYFIKGSENIKDSILEKYNNDDKAKFFIYEIDPLFSQRESELIQHFLQKHGKMPDTGDDLDDLF